MSLNNDHMLPARIRNMRQMKDILDAEDIILAELEAIIDDMYQRASMLHEELVNEAWLEDKLEEKTGADVEVTADAEQLLVNVDMDVSSLDEIDIEAVRKFLEKWLPAHLQYDLTCLLKYANEHIEEFILQNINICTAIPFWGCQLLDGSILLDGSQLLDAGRAYNADVGLLYDYGDVETGQSADLAAVAILMAMETAETAETAGGIKVAASIGFWQEYEGQYNTAAVTVTADIETSEDLAAELTITRNLHYFDGSVLMDGSTLLNSIEKEEI